MIVAAALLLPLSVVAFAASGTSALGGERARASPDGHGFDGLEEFYDVPDAIAPAPPGSIVRAQPIPAPEGMQAWRVLYHSTDHHDTDVVVSGVVVAPAGDAAGAGEAPLPARRVVTFGHGTTGINDACAPSRSDLPLAGIAITLDFVEAGYVVVATDYPGLGTPGAHPIYVAESAGRAVLDIARAARYLPETRAGNDAVVWGYSQGGQAALAAGGIAAAYAPDLHVRGVVATAALADLPASLDRLQRNGDGVAYLLLAATGLAASEQGVDLSAILTPTGRELAHVAESDCALALIEASIGETKATVFSVDPLEAAPFADGFARQRDAVLAPMPPSLILQGDFDQVIDRQTTDGVVDVLCAIGNIVDYRRYPLADHGTILAVSHGHLQLWVDERFEDRPINDICFLRRSSPPAS